MSDKQNPTGKGRVLRNGLVGASTESITLSAHRAQHLIATYGVRPELVALIASMAFGAGDGHG